MNSQIFYFSFIIIEPSRLSLGTDLIDPAGATGDTQLGHFGGGLGVMLGVILRAILEIILGIILEAFKIETNICKQLI